MQQPTTQPDPSPPYPYPPWAQQPPYRQAADWAPHHLQRRPAPPTRAFRPIELAAVAAIAIAVDITLWHDGLNGGGFGSALFFALIPAAMLGAMQRRRLTARVAVIGGLIALVALRCVFEPTPLLSFFGILLIGTFGLALRRRELFVPDIFLSTLAGCAKLPSRVGGALRGIKALAARTKLGNISILPIAVPAVLILAFLGVFALANPVLANGLSTAFQAIASFISLPSPGRIFFWVVTLGLATVLLRPSLWFAKGTEAAHTESEAATTSVQIARNALAGLNVLFLGYLALDARFLVSGSAPAGMTTQIYAHQGAFWLTVALLMLTALIGYLFRGALAHDPSAKTTRTLAYAWMGQGLVLGVGTYRRIGIHIAHSGLSDLRIVGILGTTLVLSGVVLVALKLQRQKTFMWLVRRQLDAFALTAIVYALAPTHAISASVNVDRVTNGEYTPLLHAFVQSHHAESAATLLPLLHHPDVRVREGVGALLTDERTLLRAEVAHQDSWRARDLASSRALAQLEAHNAEIDGALGTASPTDARRVLLEITHVANEDRSLEEIFAVPAAHRYDGSTNQRSRDNY